MNTTNLQTDPLQSIYPDIKKILEFTEFKNLEVANAAETEETRGAAELYMNAQIQRDNYVTYAKWWTQDMFLEVQNNVTYRQFQEYQAHPFNVPLKFRDVLLERGRQAYLNQYVEKNSYYRMLQGLPNYDDNETFYMSTELESKYNAPHVPIHQQSVYVQSLFMGTDEYQQLITDHPDKTYLKYIGRYKIDLYTARHAKDFEIIRYPANRTDINPNLLSVFHELYADAREYVMVVLYNTELESAYKGYRSFMGVLIICYALLQVGNKALESVNNRRYLDDALLYTTLSMYGIPDNLLLTKEVRRNLAIHLLKLVREKGTSDVYYDLIEVLGYQDVVISKLMLMKGQQFDPNKDNEALQKFEPYFLQLDLKDKNPYETIADGKAPTYSYHEIIDGDPMWWDLPDVQKILHESQYTMSESKYIVVEAVIHQMEYLFESIYFTRMILDNKTATDEFMIEIPEIFGTELVSVYDLILYTICATCMVNGLTGEIITHTDKMLATAGFNFDIDLNALEEFLDTTKYVEKERIHKFTANLFVAGTDDISRLLNDVMYPMREWLENKIAAATNREEFLEYESIYKALFTYDITRHKFLDDFEMPIETIRKKYNLSEDEMLALRYFYPRNNDGTAVTVETYGKSRYHTPFLSVDDSVDWYIEVSVETDQGTDDRGKLYIHDILNYDDLRELTTSDNRRMFMDYNSDEGWEVNTQVVERVLELIDELDDDDLAKAYFQIYTPVSGSKTRKGFAEGEKLPAILRTGIVKDILKEKITMDMAGLAKPPVTYFEALYRKNPNLYDLLFKDDRFYKDRNKWLNDAMVIVLAIESGLSVHLKYFEQSVLGEDLFFKPLITLIKHFKSILVDIARTGLTYVFDDKMDAGGNSNMFKLFDNIEMTKHYAPLGDEWDGTPFGIYDTEHQMTYFPILADRTEMIKYTIGQGFAAEERTAAMGSIRMVDEVKLFKNGTELDPSGQTAYWETGEPGLGRWTDDDDFLMRARKDVQHIQNRPVDMEGWKDFVESYNPE